MALLASLSPARRRLAAGVLALVVLALVVVIVAVVRQQRGVDPVAQDRGGPVLLVPGYGGSTTGLEVLADALEDDGRDVRVVEALGSGTGDLRDQAAHLGDVVDETLDETGAPSVDVVGYSAGGVVLRLYVADLGGGSTVRRAVTLASPHHGTNLASLARALGTQACPDACEQLDPDSDLMRDLNAGDETPDGPEWVALWTEDDDTVVPPVSGALDGALAYSIQDVCPGLTASHGQVPVAPEVAAMVEAAIGTAGPVEPDAAVCES